MKQITNLNIFKIVIQSFGNLFAEVDIVLFQLADGVVEVVYCIGRC